MATPIQSAPDLLDKFKKRRRFRRLASITLTISVLAVTFFVTSHVQIERDSWQDLLGTTLLLGLMWGNIVFITYSRQHRFPGIILWVRKFNRGYISRYLAALWDTSAEPWGQVITLTDTGVQSPRRRILGCVGFCSAWTCMMLFLPRDLWLPNYLGGKHLIDNGLTMLVLIWAGCAICVAVLLRRVVLRIRTESDMDRVESLLRRVRLQRHFLWSGHLKLVQADSRDDGLWKSAFMTIAQQADAIIIDCGDSLSEGVEWELSTLTRSSTLSTKVILALPLESHALFKPFLDSAIQRRVQDIIGSIPDERIFYYPTGPSRFDVRRGRNIVRQAEQIIGLAVCSTPSLQNRSKTRVASPSFPALPR